MQGVFYALLFHTFKILHVKDERMWRWICGRRWQFGLRIWPETCLEFQMPASPGENRAVLLVAKSASGSGFYILNNSTQRRNSWKHNSFSVSQEFSHILWNRNVHRRFHKSIPSVPILSQINAIHVRNRFA